MGNQPVPNSNFMIMGIDSAQATEQMIIEPTNGVSDDTDLGTTADKVASQLTEEPACMPFYP